MGTPPLPKEKAKNTMTKSIIVSGAAVPVVNALTSALLDARSAFAVGFGSTYGLSKTYAVAMLALYPYNKAKGKKPLFCKESGAEFDAWKGAATIAASAKGIDTGAAAFKDKLRDQVREVRKQAAILCGLKTGKGAKTNEARDVETWLREELPGWLKRTNKDETGSAKVAAAYEGFVKMAKQLGLNPAAIIAKSNT